MRNVNDPTKPTPFESPVPLDTDSELMKVPDIAQLQAVIRHAEHLAHLDTTGWGTTATKEWRDSINDDLLDALHIITTLPTHHIKRG